MLETLRGLGYSTATALADVIDNSVAAHATTVEVAFEWNSFASTISVLDDGCGMTDGELERAMRLGEKGPLQDRAADDLGRFGIGLKTASLSQCRRLTVASIRDGQRSCLRWDLDVIAKSVDDGWHLLEGAHPGSESQFARLWSRTTGTMILWEVMDRIVTPGSNEQDFLDEIDSVEKHLSMVFHRYLAGPRPALRLLLNKQPIRPWDPFLTDHQATWSSPVDRIATADGMVEVQAFVLPHGDRLDAREQQSAGGPDGWTSQQGFYVYRNKRMLVAGSWLGLGRGKSLTKEEASRLARIRLDVPNTSDAAWKIDIRKSTAKPPIELKNRLTRIAEDARARARRVFAFRGSGNREGGVQSVMHAWRTEQFKGGVRYRVDTAHPAVRDVLENSGIAESAVRAMLRVIEETVPVQRIWLDTAEAKETPRTGFAGQPDSDILPVLRVVYRNMLTRKGLSPAEAREQLLATEPFNDHVHLVLSLSDEMDEPLMKDGATK